MGNAKNLCRYCGASAPLRMRNEEMILWMEFHLPCWEPAHRKCTDECELDASLYLRGRQFEIADETSDAVRAYARALDRLNARQSAERGD